MQCVFQKKDRAFTLIELLIVVAIIAILAAIAVPNFLEAQVRSKVSRAKADMRSIATALEAYAIDYNNYPLSMYCSVGDSSTMAWQVNPNYAAYLFKLLPITTPVAYMTSIPEDPFANGFIGKSPEEETAPYKMPWISETGPARSADYVRPFPFDYVRENTDETTWMGNYTSVAARWLMRSVGPDLEASRVSGILDYVRPPYDPTNGTTSTGDIYMIGPGVGFDYPLPENLP